MTFQVALKGSDGYVIASDRKMVFSEEDPRTGELRRTTELSTKLFFQPDSLLACACSGKGFTLLAKDKIFQVASGNANIFSTERGFTDVVSEEARKAWNEDNRRERTDTGEMLIAALIAGDHRLFRFIVSEAPRYFAVDERTFAGDRSNQAVLWIEEFYRPGLPVEKLKLLGAHTVLAAARFNSATIEGLEMVSCVGNQIVSVSKAELDELSKKSKALRTFVEAELLR